MAEIWNEQFQRELQRLYDLSQTISTSGATSISPVTTVGPGADQILTASSRYAFAKKLVAGAGNTGAIAISIPAADGRVAVVRKVQMVGFATNEYQALLASTPGATYTPNDFPGVPLNKRNDPGNVGPNWFFTTVGAGPGVGDAISHQQFGTTPTRWATLEDIVLIPGTALVIQCIALAQTYLVDFVVDVYNPLTK